MAGERVEDDSVSTPAPTDRVLTGVPGLDQILGGGLPAYRLYLIDGEPGSGKTTLGLQFLLDGVARGERGLYVTLSETKGELAAVAASHGWSLEGIDVFELPTAMEAGEDETYTLFHPAEVELQQTMAAVLAFVEQRRPVRVVFDSLSEMRLLARDPLRFRRQILALKQFFAGRQSTIVLLDDKASPEGDLQLHSLAHGVVVLTHVAIDYGEDRRRVRVAKLRGAAFHDGYHDFRILTGGIRVYPRIRAQGPALPGSDVAVSSGSPELDLLLGGGLTRGTSALCMGAAGTGKSVLAVQYACAAANRGDRVRFYMFDERATTFDRRAAGLGMDLSAPLRDGRLIVRQIEPTAMSPGEFADEVAHAVEDGGTSLIVVDSINGYLQAMPSERQLAVQVHELLSYLARQRVTIVMTLVQRGVFGGPIDEVADVSYLADTVVLLRYFEYAGSVRQAISVVKKRSGPHEHAIREYQIGRGGLHVGQPLHEFQGVLTGVPQYTGQQSPLMPTANAPAR